MEQNTTAPSEPFTPDKTPNTDYVRDFVAQSRAAQGLPRQVQCPATLAKVANTMKRAKPST